MARRQQLPQHPRVAAAVLVKLRHRLLLLRAAVDRSRKTVPLLRRVAEVDTVGTPPRRAAAVDVAVDVDAVRRPPLPPWLLPRLRVRAVAAVAAATPAALAAAVVALRARSRRMSSTLAERER